MRIAFISQPRDFSVASGAQRGSVGRSASRLASSHVTMEIVEPGLTGAFVERNDAERLAAAIIAILRLEAAQATEMRRAARSAARERFGWPGTVAALESLYTPVRLVPALQPVPRMPRSVRRAS